MDEHEVPPELKEFSAACEQAINTRNVAAVTQLFEPDAVRVVSPGVFQAGEEMWQSAGETVSHLLPIRMSVRHIYRAGDTALMIIDYVHEGTGPDGKHMRIEGTATDVVRRGADGAWRCLISNPSGTSTS